MASLVRTLRQLAPGHPTGYRRVLSRAPWSGLAVGCALARFLLDHVIPGGPVSRAGGDTADGHPGRAVYGRARHRDPVRSSHSHTARRYGPKWVVPAVPVRSPLAHRRWALPALIDLYRSPELDRTGGRPHKAPGRLMCRLLRLPLIRFPGRASVFTGGSGFGTHGVARFRHRHRDRLTPASKSCPGANPFAPPPPCRGNGRPRVKGERVPKPRQAAATAPRTRLAVAWYGGGTRRVEAAAGAGHRYEGGRGLAPVRWAAARDATGTRRDEYPFTTDVELSPDAVAGTYRGRWNVEATRQGAGSALGLGATRGRCERTVLRAGPCLPGLYAVAAALFHSLPGPKRRGAVSWPGGDRHVLRRPACGPPVAVG